jgi:hypothetical protein
MRKSSVRGMFFSSQSVESLKRKNRHCWRFCQNFGLSRFSCFYVNLPPFHRLWAGIAKVKVKVKTGEGHGKTQMLVKIRVNSAANLPVWQARKRKIKPYRRLSCRQSAA